VNVSASLIHRRPRRASNRSVPGSELNGCLRKTGRDGLIFIELINGPFLFREKGRPDEYKAGLDLAIARAGWSCTKAVPSSGSRRRVLSRSLDARR
jgi:hypothetical protein